MKGRNDSAALLSNRRIAVVKAGMMLSAAAMVGVMGASHAKAANGTWGGLDNNGTWSDAANWTAVPGATTGNSNGDTGTFAFPNTSAGLITVDSGRNLKSIAFDSTIQPG